MKYLIFCLLFAVLFKFLYNYRRYRRMKNLQSKYRQWVRSNSSPDDDSISSAYTEITDLISDADLKDVYLKKTDTENDLKLNILSSNIIDNELTDKVMNIVSGKFEHEYRKALNPLNWIETIVFLPKSLLDYIGLSKDTVANKLLQVFLTVVYWAVSAFCLLYQDNIPDIVKSLMEKLA
ncbi:MAG: hypothetical protein NC489_39450 [Ruminococcus flavefaciens]|nr:hypothetical protein [Ruminococcus flavefaciens]